VRLDIPDIQFDIPAKAIKLCNFVCRSTLLARLFQHVCDDNKRALLAPWLGNNILHLSEFKLFWEAPMHLIGHPVRTRSPFPSHDVIVLSKPYSFAEVGMASLARSVFTVSHHLAKESPRNDGRMKDASKETLVLAEDLAEQFFGEQLRKTFDWKSTKDALQLEGALAP
jgi:hypothetical protein